MQLVEYFGNSDDLELYIVLGVFIFTIWFICNTITYYKGEKRKVRHLHRFAKEGEADAQHSLAHKYRKGYTVKKNCRKAAFWYQKAAFSGQDDAKLFLEKIRKKKQC